MQRNELIDTIKKLSPAFNERINQLSVEDLNFTIFAEQIEKTFHLLGQNYYKKIIENGFTPLEYNFIEANLLYAEGKFIKNWAESQVDEQIITLLQLCITHHLQNINFVAFLQLKEYQRDIFFHYLNNASKLNRVNEEFVNEALNDVKQKSLPNVPTYNVTQIYSPDKDPINPSQLKFSSSNSLFFKSQDKVMHGSFISSSLVRKAYTAEKDERPTYAIKSLEKEKKLINKEAKLNFLFRDAYLLEDQYDNHHIVYNYQFGKVMCDLVEIGESREEPDDDVWILPCAQTFSLRKRFEALIHLLYQFNILQGKYRKHNDNAFRNAIFDDSNCRFYIIDFDCAEKLSTPQDKENFKFLILLMRAIFCDPVLYKQMTELEKFESGKAISVFDSREKIFTLGSPIENAITRLYWALNPESEASANCTFKRAIEYCHEIYKKGEQLTEEEVVNIANKILYDNNITNDDIRNAKLSPLSPTKRLSF